MEDLDYCFESSLPCLHFLGLDDTHSDQDNNFVRILQHINRIHTH